MSLGDTYVCVLYLIWVILSGTFRNLNLVHRTVYLLHTHLAIDEAESQ